MTKPTETAPTVVLTPEEASRRSWEQFQQRASAYAEEHLGAPCPECGARSGYNEVSGVMIQTHPGNKTVDGHRDSCSQNTNAPRRPRQ
jgi:hypothetical protein